MRASLRLADPPVPPGFSGTRLTRRLAERLPGKLSRVARAKRWARFATSPTLQLARLKTKDRRIDAAPELVVRDLDGRTPGSTTGPTTRWC